MEFPGIFLYGQEHAVSSRKKKKKVCSFDPLIQYPHEPHKLLCKYLPSVANDLYEFLTEHAKITSCFTVLGQNSIHQSPE